jgi:uncharacterized protein Yka (UPF0111/DUF47 family)
MVIRETLIELQTDRIVCIERSDLLLFAEVIDTIPNPARCWVRPLAIAKSIPTSFELKFLHDLRETAQLILPIELFREALDTEVLPLLSVLFQMETNPEREKLSRVALHQFIHSLYGAD